MSLLTSARGLRPISLIAAWLLSTLLLGQSVHAQDVCATRASLINPQSAAHSGIGGTGAPASARDNDRSGNPRVPPDSRARDGTGGIGGTGTVAGRPGIGGTGRSEGGIGGTGIIGVITGFASVCVNGVEVQFDARTTVTENGQATSAKKLAVGQVVAIRASDLGTTLSASDIVLIHAVAGPIESVNAATREFTVLGQTAKLIASIDISRMAIGEWVQVSGHRLVQGEIVASYVELIAATAEVQLTGRVTQIDTETISVEGTRVRFNAQKIPADLTLGREISVSGQWDGRTLYPQRVDVDPTRRNLGQVKNVLLEGYVHSLEGDKLSLGREPLILAPNAEIIGGDASQLTVNQRIQIKGRISTDQRITVERIEFRGSSSGSESGSSGRASSEGSGRSGTSGSSGSSGMSGMSGMSGI